MNSVTPTPDDHLEAKLATPGTTLHCALHRLPDAHRLPCLGLFSLYGELHNLVFSQSDTVHLKLGWWYEEAARLADGRPRHPITRAISVWKDHSQADVPDWLASIEPMTGTSGFSDEAELIASCSTMTQPLFAAYSRLNQSLDTGTGADFDDNAARTISIAYPVFGFIQGLGQYLRDGIVPIPRSELTTVQPAADLLNQGFTPAFQRVMEVQYNRLSRLLIELSEGPLAATIRKHPVISTIVAIQTATLKEIQRGNLDVLAGRIDITPLRKTWIAWKSYRRALQDA